MTAILGGKDSGIKACSVGMLGTSDSSLAQRGQLIPLPFLRPRPMPHVTVLARGLDWSKLGKGIPLAAMVCCDAAGEVMWGCPLWVSVVSVVI